MSLKLIVLLLWYLSGVASFIYWWTKDFDFELRYIPVAMLSGLIGPLAFVLGAFFHGDGVWPSKIIIKKRSNE